MLTFGFVTAIIFMIPPLELHLRAHLSAWQIGLISLSAPLGVVLLSRFSGIAIDHWGEQRLVCTGLLIMLVAVLFLALRPPSWGIVAFPLLLFLYDVGGGSMAGALQGFVHKVGKFIPDRMGTRQPWRPVPDLRR